MLIYLLLFLAGFLEEFISIFYYKLIQKHYKIWASIVSFLRTLIWGFVVYGIVGSFLDSPSISLEFLLRLVTYACGGAIGDYISLTIEPIIEKWVFKLQRKGRKKKWWFCFVEKK